MVDPGPGIPAGCPEPDLAEARKVIDLAQSVVDSAARRLAASDIDEEQVVAYDMAHAAAAVRTAEAALGYGESGGTEACLACAFTADITAELASRTAGREGQWGSAPGWMSPASGFVNVWRAPATLAALAGHEGRRMLDPDFDLVRETFRRFAVEKVRPNAEHVHRTNSDIPEDIIAGLGELGGFGLSVPEEYGGFATGSESDYLGMVIATEELSWGSLGIGGSLITRPEILSRALVHGGTEAQKHTWLPKLASGEVMAAVAVTEPDFGSDVASVVTAATPVPGGWLINGVKTWCTFAARAEVLMLLARTDPDRSKSHRGLSLFIVPKQRSDGKGFALTQEAPDGSPAGTPAGTPTGLPAGTPAGLPAGTPAGRMEGRPIDTIGYRGMHSYELAFENWFVPSDALIGGDEGKGRGFYLQMRGFENGRLQTAARRTRHNAGRLRSSSRLRGGPEGVRRSDRRLPADEGEARTDGVSDPGDEAIRVRGRALDGEQRRFARGVDGEGLRLPRGRVGHPRGDADTRRDGLRRGVPGEPFLRRRQGSFDLRRCRRNARAQGDRTAPRGTGVRVRTRFSRLSAEGPRAHRAATNLTAILRLASSIISSPNMTAPLRSSSVARWYVSRISHALSNCSWVGE